jgi:hypothetical protein
MVTTCTRVAPHHAGAGGSESRSGEDTCQAAERASVRLWLIPHQSRYASWNGSPEGDRPQRLRSEVEADQVALRARQADLEDLLAASPATNWPEAVETARYLLGLFAQSAAATAPRRRKLIDCVMADFDHMLDSATSTTEKPLE